MAGVQDQDLRKDDSASPAPIPLPPPPPTDPLSAEQWGILSAIADTVVPSYTASKGNRLLQHPLRTETYEAAKNRIQQLAGAQDRDSLVTSYLGESAAAQPEFRNGVSRLLAYGMDETARKQLLSVLSLLNTRAGSLFLTGHVTPLDCLPIQDREKILQNWAASRLPTLRGLCRSLTSLCTALWIRTSPTLGQALGYPRVPVHGSPSKDGYPFRFLQLPSVATSEPDVIETDVVIVGSGCGGAVAAKTLAESGLKVLVVDKGYYWSPLRLPMSESEGAAHLFHNGGMSQSDDASVSVVAGQTWGGGGTVNWSACLQTQGFVRREWSNKFGLPHFTSAEYQRDMDAVCERMGVGTSAIEHNATNRTLLEGARKLGWSAKTVPQNTAGAAHNCGYCTLGCGSCDKKGPTETFLPDAAKAGAEFLEGFECERILFEDPERGGRITTGVQGTWTSRSQDGGVIGGQAHKVIIRAKRTIVSAGTLATPFLLQQSGLTNNHIGRHLHLHPVSFLAAVWDEDIRPWEGSILTSVINELENIDGDGYGTKLEATTMLPGFFLPSFPWRNGLQAKEFAVKMKRMTGYISLSRDRYGGRVYPAPDGSRFKVAYTPSEYDKQHILEGIIRLAEMAYVQGARELHTTIQEIEPFIRPRPSPESNVHVNEISSPSVNDSEFQAWTAKIRKVGFPAPQSRFASAHQMGTCRMGSSEANSVVDPQGRVWGTEGLYVCDASVFPSASGVNPMITNMGISRGTARGIAEEMGAAPEFVAKARL